MQVELRQVGAPDPQWVEQLEDEAIAEIAAVVNGHIRRLPSNSQLRASLVRCASSLSCAAPELPRPAARAPRQPSLFVQPA